MLCFAFFYPAVLKICSTGQKSPRMCPHHIDGSFSSTLWVSSARTASHLWEQQRCRFLCQRVFWNQRNAVLLFLRERSNFRQCHRATALGWWTAERGVHPSILPVQRWEVLGCGLTESLRGVKFQSWSPELQWVTQRAWELPLFHLCLNVGGETAGSSFL